MSDFVPQFGGLIAWTWEKVQQLLFCKFSNSYFSKAISLTSSDNVFVDVFLPIICFFQKSLSCMFHEVFMRSTDRKYRISQCECACCCLSRALTGRTFWKLSQLFLHVVTEKRSCVSNRFLPSFWKPASKSVKGYFYECIHRFSGGFWTKLFSPSLSALFVIARFCYHVSGCRSIWFWTQNCHRVSQISLNFCRNAFPVILSFSLYQT